jgi:hypothetical protein
MSGSASVTTLDQLFALAAADWDAPPPPPVMGGGTGPHVSSTSISLLITIMDPATNMQPNPLGLITDASYSATLNYSPSRRVTQGRPPGIHQIPASFSGRNVPHGTDLTKIYVSIGETLSGDFGALLEVLALNDGVVPNPPITMMFAITPPGGSGQLPQGARPTPPSSPQQPGGQPSIQIFFSGSATVNGNPAVCDFLISQYAFTRTP